MDAVIHSAIEEICCEGTKGLRIGDLWLKLGPCLKSHGLPLCPNVKRAVWENLVVVPGLVYEARGGVGLVASKEDFVKLTVQECEEMNVKIAASEAMRKGFLGIYETEASETSLSDVQRLILERLAVVRTNGIAQNDLTKELGIPANNLSYPLKRLETQRLIVRKPTVIRKKKAIQSRDPNNCSIVNTNMLYLRRYGEHLGYQQRLEITREDKHLMDVEVAEGDGEAGNDFDKNTDDIHVKDFLPALKAICEKLEKAKGKVLVISDLKRDLGYRGKAAHRTWRNLCHRLKDSQLVEECCTMINNKEVRCLRLVQSFSPLYFETKNQESGHLNDETKEPNNLLKRGQINEQVVELPISRQIYHMIDAAGARGLTSTEVCKRLGLCMKVYHKRYFQQMVARFGLYLQPEGQNRAEIYRVWTPGNFNPSSNMSLVDRGKFQQDVNDLNPHHMHGSSNLEHPQSAQVLDTSATIWKVGSIRDTENDAMAADEHSEGRNDDENSNMSLVLFSQPDSVGVSDESLKVTTSLTSSVQPEAQDLSIVSSSRKRGNRKYPRLTVSAASIQREQLIIRFLQEEKFLISYELLRYLNDLEKVNTTMDRKTLERILNKLQQEGHCKCTTVSIPADTNCSSNRTANVVLLPSCKMSPELLHKIHERFRSSIAQSRKQKKAQLTPVLNDVQRIPSCVRADDKSSYLEVMRANGFVLGKMVRTKLLHVFLWEWIHSSPGLIDAMLPSKNSCHSTYKLFDLYLAIQSMPLELFLRIVGSTQTCDDMISKFGNGHLLSNLSVEDYRSLMDMQATGRLSKLVYILQRLKLIRLVSKGESDDGYCITDTTLTYAMEVKPYIEEPASLVASSSSFPLDLRPLVRHDFVLSSQKAVLDYWNTLEYCYAAAKSRTALLAFPGSAVPEVFSSKSWAPSLVLTSQLRGELIKRIAEYDSNKKLSLRECEKIAEELNVTMEQVLRVYYDKRKRDRLQGLEEVRSEEVMTAICKRKLTSRKRARFPKTLLSKNSSPLDSVDPLLSADKDFVDEQGLSASKDFDLNLQNKKEGTLVPFDMGDVIHRSNKKLDLSSSTSVRQKKFFWTEESDRQLVIAYAMQRAAHGPKCSTMNWASISNLPAPRAACERRISLLNRHIPFRDSLMKLCNLLGERYVKYLEIAGEKILNHGGSQKRTCNPSVGEFCPSMPVIEKWADFEDYTIKVALDDALRHKRMVDLQTEHSSIGREISHSVAIANAMELFKLIFLSNKKAPEVPILLAETLRHYAENDLYAAFDYLREKKMIIGGSTGSSFALSRHFFDSISSSLFPKDTGKRAANFVSWLQEREKDLIGEGVDVSSDMQCGEVFTLCSLVSSGEISITPHLPDGGVGEAKDNRNSKRKCCTGEQDDEQTSKRLRPAFPGEGEMISRREKGFPGIRLCLLHEIISRSLAIESFKPRLMDCASSFSGEDQICPGSSLDLNATSLCSGAADCEGGFLESGDVVLPETSAGESSWEKMSSYSEHLIASCSHDIKESSIHPDLFRTLYLAIQRSGDNGLSFKEIHNVLENDDAVLLEIMVDVLGTFGRVLKVNAYDEYRVVDALYRSKYFLMPWHDQRGTRLTNQQGKVENEHLLNHVDMVASSQHANDDEVHRVTILNLPGDTTDTQAASSIDDSAKGSQHSISDPLEINKADNCELLSTDIFKCKPLLPWMNGDGSIVYEGLTRRVLGIVTQNPGILEESIINQIEGLNPQSCRQLLETMTLDKHIVPRKLLQATSSPPSLLGNTSRKPKFVTRVHYFPNLTPDVITLL